MPPHEITMAATRDAELMQSATVVAIFVGVSGRG